jgi:hypothetical protein
VGGIGQGVTGIKQGTTVLHGCNGPSLSCAISPSAVRSLRLDQIIGILLLAQPISKKKATPPMHRDLRGFERAIVNAPFDETGGPDDGPP